HLADRAAARPEAQLHVVDADPPQVLQVVDQVPTTDPEPEVDRGGGLLGVLRQVDAERLCEGFEHLAVVPTALVPTTAVAPGSPGRGAVAPGSPGRGDHHLPPLLDRAPL